MCAERQQIQMGFMADGVDGSVAGVLYLDPEHEPVSVVEANQSPGQGTQESFFAAFMRRSPLASLHLPFSPSLLLFLFPLLPPTCPTGKRQCVQWLKRCVQ